MGTPTSSLSRNALLLVITKEKVLRIDFPKMTKTTLMKFSDRLHGTQSISSCPVGSLLVVVALTVIFDMVRVDASVYDLKSGARRIHWIPALTGSDPFCVTFTPDGKFLVTGGIAGTSPCGTCRLLKGFTSRIRRRSSPARRS